MEELSHPTLKLLLCHLLGEIIAMGNNCPKMAKLLCKITLCSKDWYWTICCF
jgi:hypothetical protein